MRWTLHRLDNTYNCPMVEYMSIDASRYRSSVALPLEYTDYGSFHRCFLIPWSKRLRQWCPRKFLLYVNLLDIFYVNFKQANLNQCCKDLEVLNALPLPPAPQDPDSMVSGSPTSCQTTHIVWSISCGPIQKIRKGQFCHHLTIHRACQLTSHTS